MERFINLLVTPDRKKKTFCHYQEDAAVESLGGKFADLLQEINPGFMRPVVAVGIGTDRSTGDCLGPLVGSKLREFHIRELPVYGTLDDPVHASNLAEKAQRIRSSHPSCLIVAVDASLGKSSSIGNITVAPGAIKPGAGVNKRLPEIGDLHFTGVINVGGYMEYFVLQNTRLSLVMQMANVIALSILHGYYRAQVNSGEKELAP